MSTTERSIVSTDATYEAQYAGPGYGWRVAKLETHGRVVTETTYERPFTTREQAETRAAELNAPARLEYLRGELRAERISYGELAELQGLAAFIEPGDVELLEAAGVPEFEADDAEPDDTDTDDATDATAAATRPMSETHVLWLNPLTGGTELVPPGSALDARDCEILRERFRQWQEKPGARVGDFVIFGNGDVRRFTHDWDEHGLQTNTGGGEAGSFYFGATGFCSYSGALDRCVLRETLTAMREGLTGRVWFFHHDSAGAGRAVPALVPCRLFASSLPEAP